MSTHQALPSDDPRLIAWEAWKLTDEFSGAKKWAANERHVDGSLWAAFLAGTSLREIKKPTSDGQHGVTDELLSVPRELFEWLLEYTMDLQGEYSWHKDEPRCNYQRDYKRREKHIAEGVAIRDKIPSVSDGNDNQPVATDSTQVSAPQNSEVERTGVAEKWTVKEVLPHANPSSRYAILDSLGVLPGSGYHPKEVARAIIDAHNATLPAAPSQQEQKSGE